MMHETVDLYLQAVLDGQINSVPDDMQLSMELYLMDAVAVKTAGEAHLVHWDTAEDYQ